MTKLQEQNEANDKVRLFWLLSLCLIEHAIQLNRELQKEIAMLKEGNQAYQKASALRFFFACSHVLWFRWMQICNKKWLGNMQQYGSSTQNYKWVWSGQSHCTRLHYTSENRASYVSLPPSACEKGLSQVVFVCLSSCCVFRLKKLCADWNLLREYPTSWTL